MIANFVRGTTAVVSAGHYQKRILTKRNLTNQINRCFKIAKKVIHSYPRKIINTQVKFNTGTV